MSKTHAYLEQLDPNACKHELEQGRDDHDVANGSDGHKDTLDHMLWKEGGREDGRLLLSFRGFTHEASFPVRVLWPI